MELYKTLGYKNTFECIDKLHDQILLTDTFLLSNYILVRTKMVYMIQ